MLLGLDLGTTNVKAVLTEPNGRIVAVGSAPVRLYHTAGGLEQDIEEIFSATLEAISQLASAGDLSAVRAVGVSAQGGALQILDGEGRPIGKVTSWLDGRGQKYDERLTRALGREWFRRHTGHGGSCIGPGQLLRLREENPALLDPPNQVGFVGDVIVSRLCGRRAHDATSLSIAMLLNPSLGTAERDLLTQLGIGEQQLPALIPPRQAAGKLLKELAEKTSLPAGAAVSAAIHDQYAAALGCNAIGAGDVMLGAGTAWVLLAAAESLTGPVIDDAFVCPHVVEGLYGQMLSMTNGGSALTWTLKLLGLEGQEARIDEMVADIPPGSEGVRFRPLLAPGGGAGLAGETTGCLAGLRLSHTPHHIIRATLEGLACELGRYLRMMRRAGVAVRRIVMCGGAASGCATPQIIANITALPVACTTEGPTSALGAAMIARGLLEPEAALAEISGQMKPPVRLVEPDENSEFYHELFEEYVASLHVVS